MCIGASKRNTRFHERNVWNLKVEPELTAQLRTFVSLIFHTDELFTLLINATLGQESAGRASERPMKPPHHFKDRCHPSLPFKFR
jgi:hypothetical protein